MPTDERETGAAEVKGEPAKLADEMRKMEWEPLLPVEKKLIAWSISLGVVLLAILIWVSHTYFSGR